MLGSAYSAVIDPLLEDVRRFVPRFAGMIPGDKILDVCCGTGRQVVLYGLAGLDAIGIDLDPGMLKIAVSNRLKLAVPSVSFLLADATSMPFISDGFDIVSVSFALHDKSPEAREKTISEMMRVVKPGGKLVLIDFRVPLPGNFWGFAAGVIERLAGGDHYRGFRHYRDNGGLTRLCELHGLQQIKREVRLNGLIDCVIVSNG